jgi:hypothetical protein
MINIRKFLIAVRDGGISNAQGMAMVLKENGYIADEFVGYDGEFTEEKTLRWYLGSGISIVDNEAWFAMNSWLNCIEKFVPENAILEKVNREYFDEELFNL